MKAVRSMLGLLILGQALALACDDAAGPTEMVRGQAGLFPRTIAVDSGYLYWIDDSIPASGSNAFIRRKPKDSPGAQYERVGFAAAYLTADGWLWVVEYVAERAFNIVRLDPLGQKTVMFHVENGQWAGFARNSQHLFLSYVDYTLALWQLVHIPDDDSPPNILASLDRGQTEFGHVFADESHVYWGVQPPAGQAGTTEIRRMPIPFGRAETFVAISENLSNPSAMVGDAENLYWLAGDSKGLFVAPKVGGTAKKLTSVGAASGLALDSEFIYWTEAGQWIRKLALAGGAPIDVRSIRNDALGPVTVVGFAVDDQDIYWASWAGYLATVLRIPKR